jgi:hypothetical protein
VGLAEAAVAVASTLEATAPGSTDAVVAVASILEASAVETADVASALEAAADADAVELSPMVFVIPAEASKLSTSSALVSKARKTVASTFPPIAFKPMLILGMR